MEMLSKTDLRLLAAATAIAAWMVLLFTGFALGGFVHALLLLAVLLAPWRSLPRSTAQVVDRSQHAVGKRGDGQPD